VVVTGAVIHPFFESANRIIARSRAPLSKVTSGAGLLVHVMPPSVVRTTASLATVPAVIVPSTQPVSAEGKVTDTGEKPAWPVGVEVVGGVLVVVGGVLVVVVLTGGLEDDNGVLAQPAKVKAATTAAVSGENQRIPRRTCRSTPATSLSVTSLDRA
jgi:hypothetical protein